MADTLELRLMGQENPPRLPALLAPGTRAAAPGADVFLPPGYLVATGSFDVGATARGSAEGATERTHTARADEVVVLELVDGSTLITSAARLRESLELARPDLLGADGAVLLEKLRADGVATGRGFGDAVGGLIAKVFTLVAGEVPDAIVDEALGQLANKAELGVSWAGTRALMAAIEKRLDRAPGLYRWQGASGQASDLVVPELHHWEAVAKAPAQHPLLVFVHGTGSSTLASFGDLRLADRDLWGQLEQRFRGGIFGFEHRTLSESPIENALQLVRALPVGAQVSLVSHSRGGLVADLLCLGDFDALIGRYRHELEGTGDADAQETARVKRELEDAHAAQREQLRALAAALRERRLVVQRYVRAASPANGTRLASGNIDVFLSGLLTLIGQVPFFFGNPLYAAFKRVVIEIARHRTNPRLVPGIEAMLPDSPLARLLRDAPLANAGPAPALQMAVIAGDIEGDHLLKRLGVLLTDFLLFDNDDNDLVVNTTAMLAGVAPQARARVLFDRGAHVSHFRYFSNIDTRAALRDWLTSEQPRSLTMFRALPAPGEFDAALAAATRDVAGPARPVVVVLPGVMGTHLRVARDDRVWFDPLDIAAGGIAKLAWGQPGVEADALFGMFYGPLCEALAGSHRVEPFPYDWRQPLEVLAERFGAFLEHLLQQTQQPVRILAHSMGGLVVRATIHRRRAVMDALMARDGARLVMLGTPHQGAHSMVENLLGKGDMMRTLARLDLRHDMQALLDIVAGFRGALQLLPKPGFTDTFQGQSDGGQLHDYQRAATWQAFKAQVSDRWFGDGKVGTPTQEVLDAASWLWRQDGHARPALPPEYESRSVYVFGVASNTPCGVRTDERGRLKLVGTSRGDGTVTWDSGRIGGIGRFHYMPVAHGDLTASPEHFPALMELLANGATALLPTSPPAVRAIEQAVPVSYDAGPPSADDPDALPRRLMGAAPGRRLQPGGQRARRRLDVAVRAMDLRFLAQPILVGHYEQDPIAGPQALIDRELLDGDLSQRHQLGMYAGALGTAVVVLRQPNALERRRGSLSGAVVTGLGPYDGTLGAGALLEAVRAGALRYLLQVTDVLGTEDREVRLASLLLGYNSSANLAPSASVEALVRGVIEANARFFEATRRNIRIAQLDIVELYIDTAITATYALGRLEPRLQALAQSHDTLLVCRADLDQGEGWRPRLFDTRSAGYWPRLIVTEDATRAAPLAAAADGAPRTVLAERLRFLYLGQRARAESVLQQRQPGLIERLVKQQIRNAVWSEDFGRMLFQLMTPPELKDPARELDKLVLVVDSATANLPWELMLANDATRTDADRRPLAIRMPVVRQLSSSNFRLHVRQAIARTALVIGNPSSQGFDQAYVDDQGKPLGAAADLPAAQREAEAVAELLQGLGDTQVERAIGSDCTAAAVLARLYQRPWRILHIAAHGVFGIRHRDGLARSGVLLSDGLLISAPEVAAMEVVPELVFLNCCHLGQVDTGRNDNQLAASVARELIDIGVRCVVVAGWAVSDDGAQLFAQTFYEKLLCERLPFGEAVFGARLATWQWRPQDITWGAFQAYGDPGWQAEPRRPNDGAGTARRFVSPEELIDALSARRSELSRDSGNLGRDELQREAQSIELMLKERCLPEWLELPEVQSALGATWRDLGELEKARQAWRAALRADQQACHVPIHDIERLAETEAWLGEHTQAEDLIELALRRLHDLDTLVGAHDAPSHDEATGLRRGLGAVARRQGTRRSALRGDVLKRKAALSARWMLTEATRDTPDRAAIEARHTAMLAALKHAIDAYRAVEGQPHGPQFSVRLALNRLALEALTGCSGATDREAAIELARHCARHADESFSCRPTFWDAVRQPEAMLIERLLDGLLGGSDESALAHFDALRRAYLEALSNLTVKPAQLNVVVDEFERLSLFLDVLSWLPGGTPAMARTADRLLDLARSLQPLRVARPDRPRRGDGASVSAAAPASARASASASAVSTPATSARPAPRKPAVKTAKAAKAAKAMKAVIGAKGAKPLKPTKPAKPKR